MTSPTPEPSQSTPLLQGGGHPEERVPTYRPEPLVEGRELSQMAESRIEALATRWYDKQLDYPKTKAGKHTAAAVRCCIDELGELLSALLTDTPVEPGALR